jgi:hypothetical protein
MPRLQTISSGPVTSVVVHGNEIVTCTQDGKCCRFDADTLQVASVPLQPTIEAALVSARNFSMAQNQKALAILASNGDTFIYHAATPKKSASATTVPTKVLLAASANALSTTMAISSPANHSDSVMMAVGDASGRVQLWILGAEI